VVARRGPAITAAAVAAPPVAAAPRTCAARVGSAPGEGWFPYAYGALSREMQRLREPGRGPFDVRRALDRIADAFETLPDHEGIGTRQAAETVRAQVSRMIDASPSQIEHAAATRRAFEETHTVLQRLAAGPCRGDAALMRRVDQLGEAVNAIPGDPELQRASLVPVVTALQRTQAAFLALSTSDHRRTWTAPRAAASPAAETSRID
jgi:hypothetical protein